MNTQEKEFNDNMFFKNSKPESHDKFSRGYYKTNEDYIYWEKDTDNETHILLIEKNENHFFYYVGVDIRRKNRAKFNIQD